MSSELFGHAHPRAGTRRARLPDLRVVSHTHSVPDGDTDDRLATAFFLSYFALLLLVGIAMWHAFSTASPRLAVEEAQHIAMEVPSP
jgi:hypothetical protein